MMDIGGKLYRIEVRLKADAGDQCTKILDCNGTESSVWIKLNKLPQNSNNDSPHPSLAFSYDEIGVDVEKSDTISHNTAEVAVFTKNKSELLGKAMHQFNLQPNAGPLISHLRLRLYCGRHYNGSIDIIIHYFPNQVQMHSLTASDPD